MKVKLVRTGILAAILFTALFVFPAQPAHAAECTFTSNVSPSGNWSAAGSWTAVGVACSSYPGQTFAGDTVIISSGDIITLDVSPANALASLTVNGQFNMNGAATTNRTLSVAGDVIINSPNGDIRPNNQTSTNTHTLNIGGNFTNNDTFDSDDGDFINVVLNGSATQTISGSSMDDFENLTLSSTVAGTTINATASFAVNGSLTVNANTIFSPAAAVVISGVSNAITGSGAIQVTRLDTSDAYAGQYQFSTDTFTNMTVDFAGAGNQEIDAQTYGSLRTSGSGTKSLGGSFTVNNSITVGSDTTLDLTGDTLTIVGGTVTVYGTLDQSSSLGFLQSSTSATTLTMGANGVIEVIDADGLGPAANTALRTTAGGSWIFSNLDSTGTVEYDSDDNQTITNRDYNNLTLSGTTTTKTWTLSANRTVAGNLTINDSAILTLAGGNTLNLAGNFVENSTAATPFNAGSTTINFNGTVAQTVSGTPTFNGLTINNVAGVALSGNVTVSGALTLTSGALSIGTTTLTLSSTVNCSGGSISSSTTGTVTYNQGSNGQNVCAGTYGNLTFSNFTKILQPSGTIAVAGTFNRGSQTGHTVTGSTVEYNGGAQTIADMNYNNLILTNAGTKTWTPGAARTVNGNVTINSGAPFTLSGAQTVNVLGNWSNSGTFTGASSTISFNGSSAQTIGGSSVTTFNNLTINNTSDVTLTQNVTVNGTLALTAGNLIAGNGTNQLSLGCTGTVISAGGGDVVGDVVRTCAFVAGTNYTFNNPNTLLNFASGGTFPTSILFNLVRTKPPQLDIAVPRTYTITPTGGSGYSATLRLRYANGAELTDMNEIFLRLWRHNGTRYTLQGGTVQTDPTNPYVWRTGVTVFSPWAISDNGSATAVTLSAFGARSDDLNNHAMPIFALVSLSSLMMVGVVLFRRR